MASLQLTLVIYISYIRIYIYADTLYNSYVASLSLSLIFNASIKQGRLPQDWKQANVMPVFKKGDRAQPTNYTGQYPSQVLFVKLWNVLLIYSFTP